MKKFFVLIILALATSSLSAQHFGIKGGLSFSKIKAQSEGLNISFDNLISFHFGLVHEKPIASNFYLKTGAELTRKGYKLNLSENGVDIKASLKLNYIQIPLCLELKTDVGNAKLFAQAGPFLAIALNGKEKLSIEGGGVSDSGSVELEFGSDEDQYKRLDAGLTLGTGIEINKIQISVNYDIGVVDIQNVTDSKVNTRNLYFSICAFF